MSMVRRFLLCVVLGVLVAIGINELTFLVMKSDSGRSPGTIELTIPLGTSERLANGDANSAIPANMIFVAGDTLVVKNEDKVDHKLGPLFIPSGTSASLQLDNANNYAYECSFQPSRVFGLDVKEPVTFSTRVYGILIAGVPLGLMFAIYSIIIWPVNSVKNGMI